MVEGSLLDWLKTHSGTKPWTEVAIHDESNSNDREIKKSRTCPAGTLYVSKVVSEVSVYLKVGSDG
jgi:hypothetical protein